MVKKVTLFLQNELTDGLLLAAKEDHRTPTGEAAYILEKEIKRRGLLPTPSTSAIDQLIGMMEKLSSEVTHEP